jgi:hypothetical protein
MSSHREAPEISKDPVADSTDVYAFVSPDRPDTVTIITNYIPLEDPAGGPNFFEFGDDVLYTINIDNDGDGVADVIYEFRFTTTITNPETFLYNTGPITSLDSDSWNRRQSYSVTRVMVRDPKRHTRMQRRVIGDNLACPPCNIGPRSTPDYGSLAASAIYTLDGDESVFAGQRLDGFFVDLGSIFDLGDLRPFSDLHLIPTPGKAAGVDALRAFNVHTIAIQVPITTLTIDGSKPSDVLSPKAVIGVWTTASRRRGTVRLDRGQHDAGPFTQVSRLGNPLFNEVIVPMSDKDHWNRLSPDQDEEFLKYVERPELARLIHLLYPGVFPNLATLDDTPRADLVAILLTGIPKDVIKGFQNYSGPTHADMLRLNVAVPPSASPSPFGILGGDLAGFPNGRRPADDIVAIELRAVAGVTYMLVAPSYTPDAAAGLLTDGTTGSVTFDDTFPYLQEPTSGYEVIPLDVGAP